MKRFKIGDKIAIGRIDYEITKRTKHYITFDHKAELTKNNSVKEIYVLDSIKRKIHQIDDVEYILLDRNNAWFSHWV